jgi:hypothetical protein
MESIGVMKVIQFQDASSNTTKNLFNRACNKPTQPVNRFFIFGKNTKATAKVKKSPKKPIIVKRNVEDEVKVVVTSEFDKSNNFLYADKEIDFNFEVKNDQRFNRKGDDTKRFRPQSANVPKNFMKNFKKKKYYDSHKIESEIEKYFDITKVNNSSVIKFFL